ncbi:MAG: carbohydrate-binding domain-containing protein, partial [Treponema sp.]|nr:carbohydrate-binding domain-containing protein [Treponema sp.]
VYDTKSKAIKSDKNLSINSGTIAIKTYTDGAEGLECEYTLAINGGVIEINSYDDGINASGGDDGRSGHILITGGSVFCNASGNDGIDSNGTIAISGGTVIALGTTAPEEGFDCDNNTFAITGGTLIGFGGATSKPTASATTVCTVECNVNYASVYHIEADDGAEIMTFKMPRAYNGTVCMLFGGSGMARGTSYTLYAEGSVSGGTNFHGLYSGAAYTKGSAVGTFTGSAYATLGTASGSPGPGGQPGTPGAPPRR